MSGWTVLSAIVGALAGGILGTAISTGNVVLGFMAVVIVIIYAVARFAP